MQVKIPYLFFAVLIGPSGSEKSTFAGEHFLPTEALLSDFFHGLVSKDVNDQAVTNDAFYLHNTARQRGFENLNPSLAGI